MDTPLLLEVFQRGKLYRRSAGQVVHAYETKTSVSYIKKGYIKRYLISREGNLGVQSIYGPGYLFPLTAVFAALLDQSIYSGDEVYYYEAMTDAEIYTIDRDTLRAAAAVNPLLYRDMMVEAGKRFESNIQQLENMAFKDSYERVAHQLVFYAKRFSETTAEGVRLTLPLKQQDIADILNLNRETVTRVMGRLREKGLVITNGHITVPDISKLIAVYQ